MKPLFFFFISAPVLFTSCRTQPELPVEEVRFHVSGMYCDGCVKAVTVELQRMDGLRDIQVTLDDSLVVFRAPQNKIPTNQQLSELISELGYSAIFDLNIATP